MLRSAVPSLPGPAHPCLRRPVMSGPQSSQGGAGREKASGPRRSRGGGNGSARGGGSGRRGPFNKQQHGRRPECDAGRLQRGETRGREQVSFRGPFSSDPRIAIVGGGLSGLVCAIELAQRGVRSVVFDTGEHGPGGRLGTRSAADGSLPGAPPAVGNVVFDHAAQYFTAADPAFKDMVQQWEADGAVQQWRGPVGELQRGGAFTALQDSQPRYIAVGGMRSLAQYLAARATKTLRAAGVGGPSLLDGLVEVRRPQWVSDLVPLEEECAWRLVGRGRDQGLFDAVVIAHNGKCANRLAQPAGMPQVHSQLRRLKLSANWVAMVAFQRPLGLEFEGAFVRGSPVLSWAANNTAKLGLPGGGIECWTLISTQEYGRENKVPQENIPPEARERVAVEMLAEFARCLGLPDQSALPPAVYTRVQLWGAALPQNSPRVPCIWDPQARAGVCGDWVYEGGSMQAAALSGKALAERISEMRGLEPAEAERLAAGLTGPAKPIGGTPIGQFPGARSKAAAAAAEQRSASASARRPAPACVRG